MKVAGEFAGGEIGGGKKVEAVPRGELGRVSGGFAAVAG